MKRLRVYLSSTFEDLKEYRAAAFTALEKAALDVARMEGYTAADERPLDLCLRDVGQSEIYIGLCAWRYGYVPPAEHGNPHGKSITELEYRQAESRKLRKLLFFAHPDTKTTWPDRFKDEATGEGERGAKLNAFRSELGTEKTASFFRTPDELATLVLAAIMRSGLSGRPYNVPLQPVGYVPRPNLTQALVESLIGAGAGGVAGANTLVQGAGGFGKTTLAIDACHQPEVVSAFPDGMLWVALGEKPDLAKKLSDLYVSVTCSSPAVAGLDAIGEVLAKALEGNHCLVVVDDVWRVEDLAPFLRVDGPRLLVTTRIRTLIEQAGQTAWLEVPIDEMGAGEAAALLGRGLSLGDRTRDALFGLADRLGCWPLLLDLANARLLEEHKTRGGNLAESIERVAKLFESRGVLGFDRRDSNARNAAVASSVAVGLEHAEGMYPGLADKSAEISVFPEDVSIPVRVLADLWKMDELTAEEDVVRPLDNLSILRWDRSADAVRLHDMIRRALQAQLAEPAAVHRKLIDAWGDPHRLPHDYAWRWFGWHCVHAKEVSRLRQLLVDFEWLHKKLEATEIGALVGEFDYVHDEPQVAIIQSALRASAHVLAKQPAELATQLIGRVPESDQLDLQEFFAGLRSAAPRPWLRPLTASLAAPALLRVIPVDSRVRAVAVSSDGTRIVSVDEDDTQTVWDVNKGVPLRKVRWNSGRTTSLLIGATRPGVVTTISEQGTVTWDVETGECLERDGTPHHSPPPPLTVEMESERVVWWSQVSGGLVWVAITERKGSWEGGDQHCYSIYLGRADGTVRIAVRFSDFGFAAAAIASKGLRLITCSFPTGTVVWDVENGKQIGIIPGDQAQAVACDGEGEFVVTASYSGIISLWKIDSLVGSRRDAGVHARTVVDAKVSKNEMLGFTVSVDGTANTWDLRTGTVVASIAPEASTASDVDWSLMNARIDVDKGQVDFLVRDADFRYSMGEVNSYDLATGAAVPSPIAPSVSMGGVSVSDSGALFLKSPVDLGAFVASNSTSPLCITPDGTRGVTASPDQMLWVWDVSNGTRIASFGVDSTPSCCACTARAETLIVGEQSGRVHILRLEEIAK